MPYVPLHPQPEGASGLSWFSPLHTRHLPAMHPSYRRFPTPPQSPHGRPPHPLCPNQLAGRHHFRDRVTHPSFFLCSLAMRSSSWHGPGRESEKAEQERLARLRGQEQEDLELAIRAQQG